ncbi:MAG: hypothetical protein K0S18_878 [Anaerocolumna sp.]|jgi:putative SOS response-associated peptidase YedK|nr:hypothetical protein [Anaerocolumna sp.]
MCGRYYIDDETSLEIKKILESIDKRFQKKERKTGEIYPADQAPILVAKNQVVEPMVLKWGAEGFDKGRRIINARSESIHEKNMFRHSILHRRCIIPANGFYEWNRLGNKSKYYFSDYNHDIIYMAGIYDKYQGVDCFIILTTSANNSMKEIHERMPLILNKEQMESWLFDDKYTDYLLNLTPMDLKKEEIPKEEKQIIGLQNHGMQNEIENEYQQLKFDFLK